MAFQLERVNRHPPRDPIPLPLGSRLAEKAKGLGSPAVAFVADESRIDDLLRLLISHGQTLATMRVLATGACAKPFEDACLVVERPASNGDSGADPAGRMIARGDVDGLILLRDPLGFRPSVPDVEGLMFLCDAYEVPLATNIASARILLRYLLDLG
jgi:methylglyoxal synthase